MILHIVRSSEDPEIIRDLVYFEQDLEEDAAGVTSDPLACVRREVWGMLCADDAGVVCNSAEGLAKMMTVIVTVFEAAGSTTAVSEKTETMLLRTPDQAPNTSPLVIEAAGHRYRQTTQILYVGGLDASTDTMREIKRRVRLARACYSDSSGSCMWRTDRRGTEHCQKAKRYSSCR